METPTICCVFVLTIRLWISPEHVHYAAVFGRWNPGMCWRGVLIGSCSETVFLWSSLSSTALMEVDLRGQITLHRSYPSTSQRRNAKLTLDQSLHLNRGGFPTQVFNFDPVALFLQHTFSISNVPLSAVLKRIHCCSLDCKNEMWGSGLIFVFQIPIVQVNPTLNI